MKMPHLEDMCRGTNTLFAIFIALAISTPLLNVQTTTALHLNADDIKKVSDVDVDKSNMHYGPRRDKRDSPLRREFSVWSHWSGWSTCSRSCGAGAAFRTRHCMSKIPSSYMADMPPICAGPTHEYSACNIEECPRDTPDFRATQCTVFNNKDPPVVWIPLASYGCDLLCQTLDGLYMLNFGRALDGTECLTENNKRGMCIGERCVKLGCDGVLNSAMVVDGCGICGGWNHTCGHVKERFMDEFPASEYYTYNSIATIPSGATNIRITDISGKNYIALRDEFDEFVLNGDWIIEWPGEYHRAGTSINYERHRNGTELVLSPGPTDRAVQIMIIFREPNMGVEYEYWSNPQQDVQEPAHQKAELSENQILGRHELPVVTTERPQTPYRTTVTEKPTTIPTTRPTTRRPTTPKEPVVPTAKIMIPVKPNTVESNNQDGSRRTGSKDRDRKKGKNKTKKKCGKCPKVRNRSKSYCSSDFVLHVEILSKHKEAGGQTSYDVEVRTTYKNTMHIGNREYLWVPHRCNCPRLKPGRQYIVTGNQRYFEEIGESKLVVDRNNLVNSWKDSLHKKWDKIQANRLIVCKSATRTE